MKKKRIFGMPPTIFFMMILLVFIIVYSMLVPLLHPLDLRAVNLADRMLPPSAFGFSDSGYILGTDHLGRDVATRMMYATRNSLWIALTGTIASTLVGITLGGLSGLLGGIIDDIVVFLINIRFSVPPLIIGTVIVAIFGPGDKIILVLICLIYWTNSARQTRAQIIQIKTESYIECSRAIGSSNVRIFFEHILINIASPLIVVGTLSLGSIILFESTMSFLGIGTQPPQTSLGVMISEGRDQLIQNWWLAIIPSVVIVLISLCVSLIGDWLRNSLDPKTKSR